MPNHGPNPNGPMAILSYAESRRIMDQCSMAHNSTMGGCMVGSNNHDPAMLPSGGADKARSYTSYVPHLLMGIAFVVCFGWICTFGHYWAVGHTEVETYRPDDYVELVLHIMRKLHLMG